CGIGPRLPGRWTRPSSGPARPCSAKERPGTRSIESGNGWITSSSAAGNSISTSISMTASRPGARSATTSRSSRAAIATPSSFSCGITDRRSTMRRRCWRRPSGTRVSCGSSTARWSGCRRTATAPARSTSGCGRPASPRKPRWPAMFAGAHPKAPPYLRPRPHTTVAEHHLARFDHVLGPLLFEARAVRQGKLQLHRLLDRDHQQRNVVAARLERTLSHLATAAQRTLTDPNAGQLRAHLAQIDSVLARLQGKGREELLEGAHAVGSILRKMNSIGASAGGAAHIAGFRKLIEERKTELQRIARAQLAAELPRRGAMGLDALVGKPQAAHGVLGTASLRGGFQGSAHLGGFGGGAGGGLGALAGTQALGT